MSGVAIRRQHAVALDQRRSTSRIAILVDRFPVMSETFVGNQIRAVEASGRTVEIIAFNRPETAYQPTDASLAVRSIYLDEWPAPGLASVSGSVGMARALSFAPEQKGLSLRSLLGNGARLARLLRERGVGHVHAQFAWGAAAHAIVAARLAGITVSFVGHGSDVFGTPTDLAVKLRHADLAVATCDDTVDHYLSLAPGARTATVRCGIDTERFRPEARKAEPSRGLVFVARLIERKGLRETLEAIARLPRQSRPTLDVVGDGPERAPMEILTRELGIEGVRFLGTRPADWLAAELPCYRALVAPYFEGKDGGRDTGPVVAKEALACGIPVIASSFMGLKEIVEPSCGLVVPPRDVGALSDAFGLASDWSAETWRALGDAGRRRVVERFSLVAEATALVTGIDAL